MKIVQKNKIVQLDLDEAKTLINLKYIDFLCII